MVRRSGRAAVASIFAALWLACSGERPAESPVEPPVEPPNIVLIVVDSLRADRLGCYGHDGGLSPTIDSIAAEGVVAERAIAHAPWTQPSVASLMTGLYPTAHGVVDWATATRALAGRRRVPQVPVLDDRSLVTIPELLSDAGYATAGFVANPLVSREFGFAQGFEQFDSSFAANKVPGNVVNRAALDWLDGRDRQRPFFLFLMYMDVHGPYDARPEFLEPLLDRVEVDMSESPMSERARRRLRYLDRPPSAQSDPERHERLADYRAYWVARYDAGVRELDQSLNELREGLRERSLWDDTYVVLTADHGEALREHGHWDHGDSLHAPELHVPLVFRWPGVLPENSRLRGNVRQTDLLPTLADQLGLQPVESAQGVSLARALRSGGPVGSDIAFAEGVKNRPGRKAVYSGRWKLIRNPAAGELLLYDVDTDPLEQTSVADRFRDEARRLNALLEEQVERNRALGNGRDPDEVELTEDQMQRLRALGYID